MTELRRLFILRHGKAQPSDFQHDDLRALTDEGINEAKASGAYFASLGIVLDSIYVSPFLRAQQTAKHFMDQLANTPIVETSDIITPSGKALDVAIWLSHLEAKNVLLVTHQPFAQQLVSLLANSALPIDFSMDTGTIVSLEGELFATECCTFKGFFTP